MMVYKAAAGSGCYRPLPTPICEYEKRWETRALVHNTTDLTQFTKYVSYSCACVYCQYPTKECNVKKAVVPQW